MITLRSFVRSISCWLLLPLSSFANAAPQTNLPPARNILFIVADDMRVEPVTPRGSPVITPNLDRLARRAVQFDRAYCQQALCNPSRSSLLTGLRPDTLQHWNNGTHFRERAPDVVTLPQFFTDLGYEVRNVGKIFHNWHTKEKGDRRSWTAPEFLHYANHGDDIAQVPAGTAPNTASGGPRNYGQVPLCESRDVPDEAYYDGRVAAEAVRLIDELKVGPFFLAVGFWKPHAPFNAPKRYWDLYDPSELAKLTGPRPDGAPDLAFHDSREILGLPGEQVVVTEDQAREMYHGYLANVSYLDAQVGKVLDALDRSGVADRTIIVFVSDHGFHLGEHTLWAKTSNFELDAQVPLLIAAPGSRQAGQRTASLVELVDLYPTLLELSGQPIPPALDGTSLVPILENPEVELKPAAFTQHPRPAYFDREEPFYPRVMGYSARTKQVRYTEWRDFLTGETVARELYVESDQPAETKNRVGDPVFADVEEEARGYLQARFPPKVRLVPHPRNP